MGIPNDSYYEFVLNIYGHDEEKCIYLVGKNNKNIYVLPRQGGELAYQIEHNQKVRYLKDSSGTDYIDWRAGL